MEWYENCEDGRGHMLLFFGLWLWRSLWSLWQLFSKVLRSMRGWLFGARFCSVMRKRRRCRQHASLDRRGDRVKRWVHVGCESWRKLRMNVRSLSKVCSFTWWRWKKVHATRDIYLAILEAARKTRRCAVPHIMAPSPRTMETSVDVVEFF